VAGIHGRALKKPPENLFDKMEQTPVMELNACKILVYLIKILTMGA
jgi:hypothetical protein